MNFNLHGRHGVCKTRNWLFRKLGNSRFLSTPFNTIVRAISMLIICPLAVYTYQILSSAMAI